MQGDFVRVGALATLVPGDASIAFGLVVGMSSGLELTAWLDAHQSHRFLRERSWWAEMGEGDAAQWVRFEYRTCAFNRSVWAAAEWLPVRGPVRPPPGVAWLFSTPPSLRTSATP